MLLRLCLCLCHASDRRSLSLFLSTPRFRTPTHEPRNTSNNHHHLDSEPLPTNPETPQTTTILILSTSRTEVHTQSHSPGWRRLGLKRFLSTSGWRRLGLKRFLSTSVTRRKGFEGKSKTKGL
ncbi:uncharacterized protein LOC125472831 [Pyrus x bretschneideri]|uniref:uncharacterized protein LOC125472831 n=1 Tax=Pyrus x bretschneideri TaxID=225117 RepID=UPI00202F7BA9|nr:uncharacterized protein LOC125472831 [Pyrus x bretschneideri]